MTEAIGSASVRVFYTTAPKAYDYCNQHEQRDREAEERCQHDDPDFARVTGHRVADELANIVEDPAPFVHRADDGRETVVEQDEFGCLPRDLGTALSHGDADRGGFQGRRIVDPVPGHRHEMPLSLERFHDADLLLGVDPRVDLKGLDAPIQFVVAEL